MTTATKTRTQIKIYSDGVWAGTGKLVNGIVEDCPAILGGSQDAAEEAYEAIEDAIADGASACEHAGVSYSWDIATVTA